MEVQIRVKIPHTTISFTLPYSLPFEGGYEFDWVSACSVEVKNIQVFDQRSKAVTGFEPIGTGSITISGHHGLSHVAEITVTFAGVLNIGRTIGA